MNNAKESFENLETLVIGIEQTTRSRSMANTKKANGSGQSMTGFDDYVAILRPIVSRWESLGAFIFQEENLTKILIRAQSGDIIERDGQYDHSMWQSVL